MALGFRPAVSRQARRRATAPVTLQLIAWTVGTMLLPTPGAAQTARLAGLTCTTSDVLNVSVTKGDRQLTVTWDTVAGVTEYDVTWSPASADGTTAARVQGTTYTITGLSNIVEYTVAVQADTTLTCSATVPTEVPPCPTDTLAGSVASGDNLLTASWDAVSGVTEYEIGWAPPSTDGRRAAEVDGLLYAIGSLRNGVEYRITLGAGPDNTCFVNGTPVSVDADPDPDPDPDADPDPDPDQPDDSDDSDDSDGPQDDDVPQEVPALPVGGLVGLAFALMAGGIFRRRRSAGPSPSR